MKKPLVLVLFLLSWIYLWLRAAYIPLVHDESATFFIYIQSSNFLPFHSYADANNHLLNSALSHLSFLLFGAGSLALRLPNLLFWPVFFFSVYSIIQRIQNKILQWVFFLSLVMAHNFIEFFALCRGYGMSMALLMLALLLLLRSLENRNIRDRLGCTFVLMLALSANLTLVNTILLMLIVLLTGIMLDKKSRTTRLLNTAGVLLLALLPLYYLLKYLYFLKKSGLLYYHSVEGFLQATPGTLGVMLGGFNSNIAAVIFIALSALVAIFLLYFLLKTVLLHLEEGVVFSLLLMGNLFAILLGHWLMRINYPEDRTAMFLYPILVLSVAFIMDKKENRLVRIIRYPVASLFVLFPLTFLFSMNISHSSLWYQEGIPQKFYDKILIDSRNNKQIPSIGGYMLRRFCWGYLNYRNDGQLPLVKTSAYPDMTADYQIVHMNKPVPWLYQYREIDHDLPSGLHLLKRGKMLGRQLVYSSISTKDSITSESEYFNLFEHEIDSLHADNLFVEVSFVLQSNDYPLQSAVIASVNDSKGNNVAYESLELNWFQYKWKGNATPFHQGMMLSHLPGAAKHLTVYIVNSLKKPFLIKDPHILIYKVQ